MPSRKFRSTHPLIVALGVSSIATATSWLAPSEFAAALVGLVFLGATWALVLRRDSGRDPTEFGLALGGLFEDAPLDARRMTKDTFGALGVALAASALFLPAFAIGFVLWFEPTRSFSLEHVAPDPARVALRVIDFTLGHLLVVALPEEAFFRGWLQTELDRRAPPTWRFLGARLGPSLVVTSAVFAIGHLATAPYLPRLAVFFPSLVFGFLRARTSGIGAAVLFHAFANVCSALLGAGYGLSPL